MSFRSSPDAKKPAKKQASRFNDLKFVNYELTKDEKTRCKAWLPTLEEHEDALLKFCESGYKISVKWDDYSNSYAAFAQATQPDDDNFGLLLTGRGSTPHRAVKQALYKHFMVFDLQWGGYAERRDIEELDD